MPVTFHSAQELMAAVGQHLGYSPWLMVSQERINTFAEATDDHQWIHVDPERAVSGPFGATIAHGYLTLSLCSRFLPEIMVCEGTRMGINYGVNKVRFPAPVPVNSKIRAGGEVLEASEARDGGVQLVLRLTIEIEGSERPACVVDSVSRFYW